MDAKWTSPATRRTEHSVVGRSWMAQGRHRTQAAKPTRRTSLLRCWPEGVCVFVTVSEDRCVGVGEERLQGFALILRAIDATIADVEAREDADSREQLATLRYMRERWREKAAEEARAGGDAGGPGDGESRP